MAKRLTGRTTSDATPGEMRRAPKAAAWTGLLASQPPLLAGVQTAADLARRDAKIFEIARTYGVGYAEAEVEYDAHPELYR